MRKCSSDVAATAALPLAFTAAAVAAEIEVKMLDKGAEGMMVFEPALVKIEPGDTVKFVATNKGHNAESIKGMLPRGRRAVRRQGEPGHRGHLRQARRLRREVPAALRHGHGGADRGRNAGQCRTRPRPSTHPGKAKQVFATLFGKLHRANRREVASEQSHGADPAPQAL